MKSFVKFVLALGAARGVKQEALKQTALDDQERERIVDAGDPDSSAELLVAALLLLGALCAVVFVVVYAVDDIPSKTQYLGLALGFALVSFSAAFIVFAKRIVVTEQNEEEYSEPHPEEQEDVTQIVRESGTSITRKKLLGGAAVAAGGAMSAALIAPAASFGPALSSHVLLETPWRRGRRVVREDNVPVKASDIEEGSFYSGFAEGASHELLGSPIVIVRLDPAELRLPANRAGWDAEGIVAYSKICTHAGCAINLYRTPKYAPVQPRPALVCPCHYSTFDPASGGKVLFGPAGRDLPQLPLLIDRKGNLRAGGNFSGPPGPSWWGVRMWKARFVKQ
jgi:ubiquinol-cytochrome c reductase iron-sulfur subunit